MEVKSKQRYEVVKCTPRGKQPVGTTMSNDESSEPKGKQEKSERVFDIRLV